MGYYVQFDKQGPVDAESYDEAAWRASKELIEAVQSLDVNDGPVDGLGRRGFSINVSIRA